MGDQRLRSRCGLFDKGGRVVDQEPTGVTKDIAELKLAFSLEGAELQVVAVGVTFELIRLVEKPEDWVGPLRS